MGYGSNAFRRTATGYDELYALLLGGIEGLQGAGGDVLAAVGECAVKVEGYKFYSVHWLMMLPER